MQATTLPPPLKNIELMAQYRSGQSLFPGNEILPAETILRRARIPLRRIGGLPAAISLCGRDGGQPGRGHCPGFDETLGVPGIDFRPSAFWTPRRESLQPGLLVEWFLLTVDPTKA
jgi:hypothetical protein